MMNSKKKLSGAENRKRKLELEKNVQKLPKIVNFFSKTETNEIVHNKLFETKTLSTNDVDHDSDTDGNITETETNEVVPSNSDTNSSISHTIIIPEEKNKHKVISTEIAHNKLFETKTVSTSDEDYYSAMEGNRTNCNKIHKEHI
ncbi:uncharacterized protein LOC113559917 [Rhopalosiphum maidis]|uniref:uncharacterized protein LOC113559917 n=1 Tax=Rhopalosiphum maidis TaxID=43146 RepID=UPI000EFEFCFA|nr:uncharacterized protein LOC113559917 [Rhopalosiphum maidis]